MRRRAVLGALTWGVLGADWLGSRTRSERTAHPPGKRLSLGGTSFDPTGSEPVARLTTGDPDAERHPYYSGQHTFSLWNDRSTCGFELTITGADRGRVVDWQGELGDGESVDVEFVQADSYTAVVHVQTVEDAWYWLPIPKYRFDCNSSSTNVGMGPGGRVEAGGSATLMLCGHRPADWPSPAPDGDEETTPLFSPRDD
jgi:hypothetical protein